MAWRVFNQAQLSTCLAMQGAYTVGAFWHLARRAQSSGYFACFFLIHVSNLYLVIAVYF